jgi:RNA polymerase sigma-70 factor (ECF subfamily)
MRVTGSSAIEQLYRDGADSLWWALLAYTGDREVASDAVSEAFARALGAAHTIRDPRAWVWRVAFRVATTHLREPKSRLEAVNTLVVTSASNAQEPSYEIDDRAMAVMQGLAQLSDRQRAVTVLFYLEDRPTKEIADLLGTSAVTVSVHLHRARQRLRSIIGEDDA